MSERYTRLFSLPENLYTTGSPVVIAAGALQKDNQTNQVFAQLKIQNIQDKVLKAAMVEIVPFDTVGKQLDDAVNYQYLDLSTRRDENFGSKTPVMLPDASTRSFTVSVTEMVFSDNTTWKANEECWTPLSEPVKAAEALCNAEPNTALAGELEKQYRIKYGASCQYIYKQEKDLWRCACGTLNRSDESKCHTCQKEAVAFSAWNVEELKADRDERLAEEKAEAEEQVKKNRKHAKIVAVILSAAVACVAIFLVVTQVIVPAVRYQSVEQLLENGQYDEAVTAYEELGEYRDSANRILEVHYRQADILLTEGKEFEAAIAFEKLGTYRDSKKRSFSLWDELTVRETVSTGFGHTVGLKTDGTVVAVGHNKYGECDVSDWTDIVAISANSCCTAGLKADGTVIATGDNEEGQCNVSSWTDIVAVSCGADHIVGLKADGTVVATGNNEYGQCNVSSWTDIVAISAGVADTTVGLKADGTVVSIGGHADDPYDVSRWTDILAISAGRDRTIGLNADGIVLSSRGNYALPNWTSIMAISESYGHTVGLKTDGTVVAMGEFNFDKCDVSDWTDIVAISAGCNHTVGLKSDGTVVATGSNNYGQCNVSDWKDIKVTNG